MDLFFRYGTLEKKCRRIFRFLRKNTKKVIVGSKGKKGKFVPVLT
jgi:hypothetical protein